MQDNKENENRTIKTRQPAAAKCTRPGCDYKSFKKLRAHICPKCGWNVNGT